MLIIGHSHVKHLTLPVFYLLCIPHVSFLFICKILQILQVFGCFCVKNLQFILQLHYFFDPISLMSETWNVTWNPVHFSMTNSWVWTSADISHGWHCFKTSNCDTCQPQSHTQSTLPTHTLANTCTHIHTLANTLKFHVYNNNTSDLPSLEQN